MKTKKKVLVIDDSLGYLMLIKEYLELKGYTCETAQDGESGLEMIKQNNFDAVIIDIEMPVLNGRDTALAIRNLDDLHKKQLPLFVLSAHDAEQFEEKFKKYGFNDFIPKDSNDDKIDQIIKKYLN